MGLTHLVCFGRGENVLHMPQRTLNYAYKCLIVVMIYLLVCRQCWTVEKLDAWWRDEAWVQQEPVRFCCGYGSLVVKLWNKLSRGFTHHIMWRSHTKPSLHTDTSNTYKMRVIALVTRDKDLQHIPHWFLPDLSDNNHSRRYHFTSVTH